MEGILKGSGYMENDSLHHAPFDFSMKNYFPLSTQQELMKRLFFSGQFKPSENFQLHKEDEAFLKKMMAAYPYEVGYDREEYYDSYGKFFLYGDSEEPINSGIKIYNKVGYAYGTLTDTAYIQDPENEIEFFLSATILVNQNGIFNDNQYEFDEIGIPFLAELGRQIYQYELAKKTN